MATKKDKTTLSKTKPTFEIRFGGTVPESVPLRAVSETLSAVQDLASGRDPFEVRQVPQEKGIGLVDVKRGSAIYSCVARSPTNAIENLSRFADSLNATGSGVQESLELMVASMSSLRSLSDVAKQVGCSVEVWLTSGRRKKLFEITRDDYSRISKELLVTGESTVTGFIERVGGATGMRCLMRLSGRTKILYCDVKSRDVVRRLGQCLYEQISAYGTATWIQGSWRLHAFEISDFSQPSIGAAKDLVAELRNAGLSAWDEIPDPEAYLMEERT